MDKQELIKEAKRIEEDAIHSAKGHFKAASRWRHIHLWLGIPATIAAAIAGASALSNFNHHAEIAGALSILATILSALSTFINPGQKSDLHHKSGTDFNAVKNAARFFYNIDVQTKPEAEAISQLQDLANKRDDLNRKSPQIPPYAFKAAKEGIDKGEATYNVDKL